MKLKEIVYKLDDNAIMPDKMGVISTNLYDWNIECLKYEDPIPEIAAIQELVLSSKLNDDLPECNNEYPPHGYYKKYVFYFIINTDEITSITYFPRISNTKNRLWINGALRFIGNENTVYTTELDAGNNIFCIEFCVEFSLREQPLVRIEKAQSNPPAIISLTEDNYWYNKDDFIINCSDVFFRENRIFEFDLIPANMIDFDFDNKILLVISDEENGYLLYEKEVSFKYSYKIDLSFIPNVGETEYNRLIASFYVKNNKSNYIKKSIFLHRFSGNGRYIAQLRKDAEQLLNLTEIPDLAKNEIIYCLNNLSETQSDYFYGRCLKRIIKSYKSKGLWDYYKKPGMHNIYYRSKSDNNIYFYHIVLPKNFDTNIQYPLVLTISHGSIDNVNGSSNYSEHFINEENAIYADIGGRGCTLGSYLGDYVISEELSHIINNYSIDGSRIYAIAHCAGNMALYNYAQSHPHTFAGIYTRKTNLYFPNINNLYNVNCMHLLATINTKDTMLINRRYVEKKLRKFTYVFVHRFYNADVELQHIQYTKKSMSMLLSNRNEEYPDIVYYRTERNRNRNAYYVEIESIEYNKQYASVNVEIVGHNLRIKSKNCTGLKIHLPPQIDKSNFKIEINNKVLSVINYTKNDICLKHIKNHGYRVVNSIEKDICHYRGTGLLDVYLTPLKIINGDPNSELFNNVANSFAHPVTNTDYTYIYVNYPILKISSIKEIDDCSYVIIDNNFNSNLLDEIRTYLPIEMDEYGYRYKGIDFQGDYCIMQIVANPKYKDKSILYINTNNPVLYKKNLFTRKVIMPSYSNGYHSFMNSICLIFDGKKYSTISEWGENIVEY